MEYKLLKPMVSEKRTHTKEKKWNTKLLKPTVSETCTWYKNARYIIWENKCEKETKKIGCRVTENELDMALT